MKTHHFLATVFIVTLFLLVVAVQTMVIQAPELFGGGRLYYVRFDDRIVGISDGWGWWLFHARTENKTMDCRLVKLTRGGAVDADTVACFGRFTDQTRFVGWIDFRGQRRPFCGAISAEELPGKCKGE